MIKKKKKLLTFRMVKKIIILPHNKLINIVKMEDIIINNIFYSSLNASLHINSLKFSNIVYKWLRINNSLIIKRKKSWK